MECDLEQCQRFERWHDHIYSLMSVAKKARLRLHGRRLVARDTGPSTSVSLSWASSP